MIEKILTAVGRPDVDLSIKSIIIDYQRICNKGLQILCSQQLSHVTYLSLGKTIDIKRGTK
jgi:hypothetical protein